MKICDLNTGMGRLNQAFAHLKEKWAEAKTHWHDEASRQFEEQHLRPIPTQLQLTVAAVNRLAEVLEKAERECEDDPLYV